MLPPIPITKQHMLSYLAQQYLIQNTQFIIPQNQQILEWMQSFAPKIPIPLSERDAPPEMSAQVVRFTELRLFDEANPPTLAGGEQLEKGDGIDDDSDQGGDMAEDSDSDYQSP